MQLVHDRSPTASRAGRSSTIACCAEGMCVQSRLVFEHCCSAECGRPWGSGAAGVRTDGSRCRAAARRRPFTAAAAPLRSDLISRAARGPRSAPRAPRAQRAARTPRTPLCYIKHPSLMLITTHNYIYYNCFYICLMRQTFSSNRVTFSDSTYIHNDKLYLDM